MDKIIIGIDPGSKGYIAIYEDGDYRFISLVDAPVNRIAQELAEIKKDATENGKHLIASCEEVHAIFGSSAKSTFEFGKVFGFLQGLLVANHIPYSLVPPKEWQSSIWINSDKEYSYKVSNGKDVKRVDTKKTSFNAAHRLFPEIDLRRNEKCRNEDDNKCDALLICEYTRRQNW
jgi:hypothetical protein